MSLKPTATATDPPPPLIIPSLCTVGCCCWYWSRSINNEWQKKNVFHVAKLDHFWVKRAKSETSLLSFHNFPLMNLFVMYQRSRRLSPWAGRSHVSCSFGQTYCHSCRQRHSGTVPGCNNDGSSGDDGVDVDKFTLDHSSELLHMESSVVPVSVLVFFNWIWPLCNISPCVLGSLTDPV